MENKYVKKIDKLGEYNDYREKDNEEHIEKIVKQFKKNISECKSASSIIGYCEQFIHDYKWYEQQSMVYSEIRKVLVGIAIDFEKMEENKK